MIRFFFLALIYFLHSIANDDIGNLIQRSNISSKKDGKNTVVYNILKKSESRPFTQTPKIGTDVVFDNLTVNVEKCIKQNTEYLAFFKIKDGDENIFSGWLSSERPSISSFENRSYDVILLNCL